MEVRFYLLQHRGDVGKMVLKMTREPVFCSYSGRPGSLKTQNVCSSDHYAS